MTDSTKEMLTEQVEYKGAMISQFAKQIRSGEYGNQWTVTDDDADDLTDWVVIANSEDEAIEAAIRAGANPDSDLSAERDSFDDPTICDENGNTESIYDWPLSVEVKIGRPLAVVLATGGPHVEIVQDLSDGGAKLAGYWGGEQVFRHGDDNQVVLDYFTDTLYDEAPEEYK